MEDGGGGKQNSIEMLPENGRTSLSRPGMRVHFHDPRLLPRFQVHIKSPFILNGVCVRWKGYIDMERLDGMGILEFDEETAKLEDIMLREQVEAYNRRMKEFEEYRKAQQRQLAAFMGQHQQALAAAQKQHQQQVASSTSSTSPSSEHEAPSSSSPMAATSSSPKKSSSYHEDDDDDADGIAAVDDDEDDEGIAARPTSSENLEVSP